MLKKICSLVVGCLLLTAAHTQELQARVTINSSRISSQTDKKIFQTLQAALNNFMNQRKWTKETFQPSERIVCNFLLTINQAENNFYQSSLVVQAARPVYNSSYETPLINFMDENLAFKYVEYQPLEFNENRVSGTDPAASNLTAVLAFYANIILGLDFDSFALKGGDAYFQKAQNVVNNAPDGRDILGWRAFDGQRNRYWLIENLTNSRYTLMHDALYSYYRMGMDKLYDNETEARKSVMNTLNMLNNISTEAPNAMILQFFFLGRNTEIINIFKKATPDEKARATEILAKIDVTNANRYKQELR